MGLYYMMISTKLQTIAIILPEFIARFHSKMYRLPRELNGQAHALTGKVENK